MVLRSVKSLEGYSIHATDGHIGKTVDFYFDNQNWVVRYVVVDTKKLVFKKQVLLTPHSFLKSDWHLREFQTSLSCAQIDKSPDITTHRPPARDQEREFLNYYGSPYYWEGMAVWGPGPFPVTFVRPQLHEVSRIKNEDVHLASANDLEGYTLHATDGQIGHVEDLIVDTETWAVRYLVVDTKNFWPGHPVLISTQWIHRTQWEEREVVVDLDRARIESSPKFDPHAPINREYEQELFDYYGRAKYWESNYPGEFKDRVSYSIF